MQHSRTCPLQGGRARWRQNVVQSLTCPRPCVYALCERWPACVLSWVCQQASEVFGETDCEGGSRQMRQRQSIHA
eukprot:12931357-Alexandrium_andersonii.AAC.1